MSIDLKRRPLIHLLLWRLGMAAASTQTSESERDCISKHATGKKKLAEIGVWHGVTTCRIRKVMAPDAQLLAIDPYYKGKLGFSAQRMIAHTEVSAIRNGNVEWARRTGEEAGKHQLQAGQSQTFDFLFIDGDHSYEGLKRDWETWKPLIAKDGIVALHDSRSSAFRPMEDAGSVHYTKDVILHDEQFAVVDTVESLTVLRRL